LGGRPDRTSFPGGEGVESKVIRVPEVTHVAGGLQAAKGAKPEVIDVLEVLPVNDVASWTRVIFSLVGHISSCKSQRTIMTP
jgi:hypothetical protein